jgi:hypothetical protein
MKPFRLISTSTSHALVLDGVFVLDEGIVQFRPVRRLTCEDVAGVVALIARRVERLLERRGLAGGAESGGAPDLWSEEAPVFATAAAASVERRVALGPRAGRACAGTATRPRKLNRWPWGRSGSRCAAGGRTGRRSRAALVQAAACGVDALPAERSVEADEDASRGGLSRSGAYQWAELMRRTLGFDVLRVRAASGGCGWSR